MFGWLFRKREREIEDELDYHLAMLASEKNEESGNDARLRALRRLGNRTSIREEIRRASPWVIFESGGRNATYALRTMRRNPAFSITAILTMALGICSAVLIFGILDAVVLRPLPYRDSNGIVFLWEHKRQLNDERMTVAPANYQSWRKSNRAFADMTLVEGARFHLSKNGETRTVRGLSVSPGFFRLLGAEPRIGRVPSSIHEVVLSDSFWRKQFNGSPDVIGKPIALGDRIYPVVGVMPPDFYFPDFGEEWEVWTQLELSPSEASDRDAHCCGAVARLRPGVTIVRAQRDMNQVSARLEHEFPETNRGAGVLLVPIREQSNSGSKRAVEIMIGAVCALLLIACANISILLLMPGGGAGKRDRAAASVGRVTGGSVRSIDDGEPDSGHFRRRIRCRGGIGIIATAASRSGEFASLEPGLPRWARAPLLLGSYARHQHPVRVSSGCSNDTPGFGPFENGSSIIRHRRGRVSFPAG